MLRPSSLIPLHSFLCEFLFLFLVEDFVGMLISGLIRYIVAWVCVGIGATGMLWMLWRWNKNYIWVLNKLWT